MKQQHELTKRDQVLAAEIRHCVDRLNDVLYVAAQEGIEVRLTDDYYTALGCKAPHAVIAARICKIL